MRSVLLLILVSAVVGLVLGAALGYYQARPWALGDHAEFQAQSDVDLSSADTAESQFEVPEKVFNFGKMERGTTMTHAFKIVNTGESSLSIQVVGSTCKCTVGELEQNRIAPGEETEVTLEWTAKTEAGPFRHGARLEVSPGAKEVSLTVEGDVVESTSVYPADLLFGDIAVGESAEAELLIMSSFQEDVQVTDYEFSDPRVAEQLKVEFVPASLDEMPMPSAIGGLKLKAVYQADQKIGRFSGWIDLKTNLPSAVRRTIFYAGNKIGDISIFGPSWSEAQGLLRMGAFPSDKGKTAKLNIAVRGEAAKETDFEVASVDPPQLKVSLGEKKFLGDVLMHVPLQLDVSPGTAPMARVGEPASSDAVVLLKTNHPKVSEVQLRVHFTVER